MNSHSYNIPLKPDRKIGRFPQDASDDLFSFSDVYNPVTFETARGCEARVWDFFSRVTVNSTDPEMDMSRYTDYVMGYNLTNRMALYYKPDHKLTVTEVLGYMRSHFEGTVLEFDADMGRCTTTLQKGEQEASIMHSCHIKSSFGEPVILMSFIYLLYLSTIHTQVQALMASLIGGGL